MGSVCLEVQVFVFVSFCWRIHRGEDINNFLVKERRGNAMAHSSKARVDNSVNKLNR